MDTEFGMQALADAELYKAIVEHRRKFYHVSYADYDKNYPDRIAFYPPERSLKTWESVFRLPEKQNAQAETSACACRVSRISLKPL